MDVHFVDTDGQFTAAIAAHPLGEHVSISTGDVRSLLGEHTGTAYVSPSNSFCFMDGGIDAAYREMWPGVEGRAKAQMQRLGFLTRLGRSYLPLASAMAVDTRDEHGSWLIMAPTMWLPQDVSATENAFCAVLAALHMAIRLPVDRVVIPAMCCGYGKMSPEESAAQCMRAYGVFNHVGEDRFLADANSDFCRLTIEVPQPRVYMNMEWQDFP